MENLQLSDYLENYDKSTKCGTCKVCFAQVNWARKRLIAHKKVKCTEILNIQQDELENKPSFNVGDYLENYDKLTKSGTCKTCSALVNWARSRVAAHKRKNCTANEDEKALFIKQEELGRLHIILKTLMRLRVRRID